MLKTLYYMYIPVLTRYSVILNPQYVTYKAQSWSHCDMNGFEIHNPGGNLTWAHGGQASPVIAKGEQDRRLLLNCECAMTPM